MLSSDGIETQETQFLLFKGTAEGVLHDVFRQCEVVDPKMSVKVATMRPALRRKVIG
jgi:hypothetical protein